MSFEKSHPEHLNDAAAAKGTPRSSGTLELVDDYPVPAITVDTATDVSVVSHAR